METVKTDPLKEASLYVSIPFCPSRCTYCSFVSVAAEKSHRLIEPYLERLMVEIKDKYAVLKKHNLAVKSIYIGGGTLISRMEKLLQQAASCRVAAQATGPEGLWGAKGM